MGQHDQLPEDIRDDNQTLDPPAGHQKPAENPQDNAEASHQELPQHHENVTTITEPLHSNAEELQVLNDKYLRLAAEFDNYKRRAQRDHRQAVQFANETLLRDILPTLDNLERAIQSGQQEQAGTDRGSLEGLLEGVTLTYKHFLDTLKKAGVTQFSGAGKPFDPAHHQAVGQVETSEIPEHTVVDEHQKGYFLHERILRPAMVTVAQPPKQGAET